MAVKHKASPLLSSRVAGLVALFFILPVILSCYYEGGVRTWAAPEGRIAFNRIAVLPFQEIIPEDPASETAACPLCGEVFHADRSAAASAREVEAVLMARLRELNELNIIDPESAKEVYHRATKTVKAPTTEIFRQVGKELKADGLLVGYIFRYRERKGYSYSVEKPASVALDLHLIRLSDGRPVWRGVVDKTQTSLFENLLQYPSFFRRGIRWLTVKELTDEGLLEILRTFPAPG